MITIIIILITTFASIRAFGNRYVFDKFIFNPKAVHKGQWYRLFSYGFLHADFAHLIFNMFTFYLFGSAVEHVFKMTFGVTMGGVYFIGLYLLGFPLSIIPTYIKHKHNSYYRSLGASGSVSAFVFAYILLNPMNFMGILFIPIMLPAFIFGILFIFISVRLKKKQAGNINHSAHIAGGIWGVIMPIVTFAVAAHINILQNFVEQIKIQSVADLIHFGF